METYIDRTSEYYLTTENFKLIYGSKFMCKSTAHLGRTFLICYESIMYPIGIVKNIVGYISRTINHGDI